MSRNVIHDVVIPIISRIMVEEGYYNPQRAFDIRDENFEEYLEEEMRRHFSVIGADGCQHLREQLEEAKKNDPYAFEELLRKLLKKYVKLAVKIRKAKQMENRGPPDRFAEQRRRHRLLEYQA